MEEKTTLDDSAESPKELLCSGTERSVVLGSVPIGAAGKAGNFFFPLTPLKREGFVRGRSIRAGSP